MNTIVINLYGGPGVGKSTIAAGLYYRMKQLGISCELVSEFAKEAIYDGNKKIFNDQYYIFGTQHYRMLRLMGEVKYIICDSPLLLCPIYNKIKDNIFEELVYNEDIKFQQINYFISRTNKYDIAGRNETEEQAYLIDIKIQKLLVDKNIYYTHICIDNAIETILNSLKN